MSGRSSRPNTLRDVNARWVCRYKIALSMEPQMAAPEMYKPARRDVIGLGLSTPPVAGLPTVPAAASRQAMATHQTKGTTT